MEHLYTYWGVSIQIFVLLNRAKTVRNTNNGATIYGFMSVLHVRLQAFFAVQVELKALRMFRFLFRMTPITRVRARLRLSSNTVLHDVCPDCEREGRRTHALEIKHYEMQEFLVCYIKNLDGHGGRRPLPRQYGTRTNSPIPQGCEKAECNTDSGRITEARRNTRSASSWQSSAAPG